MVLPLITRNTQEALKTVPDSYRHGAVGLGAGKWHTIRTILLPSAMPGIITGVILAIGRIVGESAALLFTAGSAGMLPKVASGYFSKIMQSGGTLTIKLYLAATSEGKFRPGIWNCGCASRNCILNQHPDKGAGKEIPGEVSKSTGYYNDMRVKRYFTPLIIIIN